MPKVHCLQHESFEGMAAIKGWLTDHHFDITYTRFYESPALPETDDFDWLIIMGGPMSVNDEKQYPWLKTEKQYIKNAIERDKVVIGICLGAQLIANALGSRVYPNTYTEIGWFPISTNQQSQLGLLADFPDCIHVFHWHGETFDLPPGAIHLASSEACQNQIFSINNKIIGFQCHMEVDTPALLGFLDGDENTIIPAKYVQTGQEMLKLEKKYSQPMNEVLFSLLAKLKN